MKSPVKKPPPRTTVRKFISAIGKLPSDKPVVSEAWYLTQKQHWLGWLRYYNSAGAYGRKPRMNRGAAFAYNHIVEPKMLLWIVSAARVSPALVRAARRDAKDVASMPGRSAMVRKHVPWTVLANALWPK
jgi:hypothetical protein